MLAKDVYHDKVLLRSRVVPVQCTSIGNANVYATTCQSVPGLIEKLHEVMSHSVGAMPC